MYYIRCLDMFRAIVCSSSGGTNCILQHLICHSLWESILNQCTARPLTESDIPDAVSCAGRCDLHTKRSPTQSDIYQMLYWYNWFSWWRARGCSKHVENWNKHMERNCASSWSFTKNYVSCYTGWLDCDVSCVT
jgi:hypothetical protein